jgi:CDP-diacylglycerol--glycerol-3-phosphate 3-phosphatidyltransferase
MNPLLTRLPNSLSILRLLSTPLLVWLAWKGWQMTFLYVLALALVTDVLDGMLARRLDLTSELGAHLDSWSDIALYTALAISAHLLWPEEMASERFYVVLALSGIALSALASLIKFSALPSYHTLMAKGTAVLLALGCLIMFSGGAHWPFRLACAACFISSLEQTLITLCLSERKSNVKSLWHIDFHRPSRP